MPAFSPINENVFTTEAWILLGPPVHKLYGWLPLITVLLETCMWSGLIGACLAPERAPMCFAWIVGNQQGFTLPGNSIVGSSSCRLGDVDAHHQMECFLYSGQRKGKDVRGVKEASRASYLECRACVQTHLAGTSPDHWMMPFQWTQRLWSLLLCIIQENHACSLSCSL